MTGFQRLASWLQETNNNRCFGLLRSFNVPCLCRNSVKTNRTRDNYMIIKHDFARKAKQSQAVDTNRVTASVPVGLGAALLLGLENFSGPIPLDQAGNDDRVHMPLSTFMAMDKDAFETLSPGSIYSPVIANEADAMELAGKLQDLGYRGEYRILAQELADPWMIMRELRDAAPDVKISLSYTRTIEDISA